MFSNASLCVIGSTIASTSCGMSVQASEHMGAWDDKTQIMFAEKNISTYVVSTIKATVMSAHIIKAVYTQNHLPPNQL